jgi:hypothetical protein
MEYFKLLFDLLPSPTDNFKGIGGIVYGNSCSRCGFSDEMQVKNLVYKFRSHPQTDIFSGLLPEPLVNRSVFTLLTENNVTGVSFREIEIDPDSTIQISCKEKFYQLIINGRGGRVASQTKLRKNPDWCNKCGRNQTYVVDSDDVIYYSPLDLELDFIKFDDQIEPIISNRVKDLFEHNRITGVKKILKCIQV